MHKKMLEMVREIRGPFTQELVEGWHKKDLEDVDKYTEACIRSIFRSLTERGIYFDGVERVCPVEFYKEITKSTGSGSKDFEVSKHSFFGVRLKLHFICPQTGVRSELKQPLIFLPYTNRHGDVYVRNSLYSLQLVLAERGPSVDGVRYKTIFIRVLGYKFKVTMELFKFYRLHAGQEGQVSRFPVSMKLPANRFYNSKNDRKIKEKNAPIPTLAWYVFSKYGFNEAMTRFANMEYRMGIEAEILRQCPESEGWVVLVNGGGVHPKAFVQDVELTDPPFAIAIRGEGADSPNSLGMQYAGAFLFMMAVMGEGHDLNAIDDPLYWRLIIGYCSINLGKRYPKKGFNFAQVRKSMEKDNGSKFPVEATNLRQMAEHAVSVDEYADEFTIDRWNKSNIPIKDTYELFNHLIANYSNIIRSYSPADLLHKELASKEFLLENLIHAANEFKFTIRNKPNTTPKIINRELDRHFKLFGIDSSIRENNAILEQTGTDNPFVDYGLGIIRQTKSTVRTHPGSKKDGFDPNHPGSLIHPSQLVVVSYQFPSEPHPDATANLSPRVCLVQGRYIDIHDHDREFYEAAKRRLATGESS